jgi:hypothetical protein
VRDIGGAAVAGVDASIEMQKRDAESFNKTDKR